MFVPPTPLPSAGFVTHASLGWIPAPLLLGCIQARPPQQALLGASVPPSSLHQSSVQLRQGGGQLLSLRSRKDKPSTYPAPAIGKVPGWCLTYCILITLILSFLEDAVLILLDERRN